MHPIGRRALLGSVFLAVAVYFGDDLYVRLKLAAAKSDDPFETVTYPRVLAIPRNPLLEDDELMRRQGYFHERRAVRSALDGHAPCVSVAVAHDIANLVQGGVDDDGILARLVGNVVGDEHLVTIEDAGEAERVGESEGQAEVDAVSRDLAEIHPPETQRECGLHHARDLGDLRADSG